MPKKKKPTVRRTQEGVVYLPQSMAHTFQRQFELSPAHLEKMKAVLAKGMPIKIALDVRSKLFSPVVQQTKKKPGEDGEIVIDDEEFQPPDPGEEIPEEEEEEGPELPPGSSLSELTGVSIEVYAVAVFRPTYSKTP